jgi:hypothetical protein
LAALPAFSCSPDTVAHQLDPLDSDSGDVSAKALLTMEDFDYIGAFRLPRDIDGHDGAWGRGFAIRDVGGEMHFLSSAVDGVIYEAVIPQLGTQGQYPQASVSKVWGDLSKGHRVGQLNGLFWDPIDRRLYWSAGNLYNTLHPDDPSMGYSTLEDGSTFGAWKFSGRGAKATMGGVLAIPDWFATQFTKGQRLAAGFGGYWSIVATGPAHMGPALCSFDPPAPDSTKGGALPFTNLVGYPFNPHPYTEPDRCHRDTDYHTEFDGWNPKDGVGYWSWSDWIWQGAAWIDLPDKHGVVFTPTLGRGRTWYQDSTLHAERSVHAFYVYDPAQLAAVARGKTKQWEVQPAASWDVHFENLTYPLPGWKDEPNRMITGVTFDQAHRILYVAVRFAFGVGAEAQHLVYAYRIG